MANISLKSGYVVPFLAGLAVAPFVKPRLRFAVKTSVEVALQVKTVAAGAAEELQDIVAEASAGTATGTVKPSSVTVIPPGTL